MAQHSASGVRGLIRKYSSDSDSSPQKPATKKHINTTMEVILKDIQSKLDTVISDQKGLRQSMETRIENLKRDLVMKIASESKALLDEMYIELTKVGDRVNVIENHLSSFEADLRAEVTQLKSRVLNVESNTGSEPFAPDVTIVASGLRFSEGEDILAKAKDLITSGLQLSAEVVNAERTPARDGRPGIVKIEFPDVDTKVQVLRAKMNLANDNRYKRVYLRSAQTHAERVLHNNTMTLLKEIGADRKYRVAGSGRLVPRTPQEQGRSFSEAAAQDGTQSAPRASAQRPR